MKKYLKENKRIIIIVAFLLIVFFGRLSSAFSVNKITGRILFTFFGIMLVTLFFGIQLLLCSVSEKNIVRYSFVFLAAIGYVSLIMLALYDRYEGFIVALALGYLLSIGMIGIAFGMSFYNFLAKENAADMRTVRRFAVKLSLGCIIAAISYFILLFSIT